MKPHLLSINWTIRLNIYSINPSIYSSLEGFATTAYTLCWLLTLNGDLLWISRSTYLSLSPALWESLIVCAHFVRELSLTQIVQPSQEGTLLQHCRAHSPQHLRKVRARDCSENQCYLILDHCPMCGGERLVHVWGEYVCGYKEGYSSLELRPMWPGKEDHKVGGPVYSMTNCRSSCV